MDGHIRTASEDFQPLRDEEIEMFFHDLDKDNDGYVTFDELEAKLHKVHKELASEPQTHHLHHPTRQGLEKNESHAEDGLHAFLCRIMPECAPRLSKDDFRNRVRAWEIPSQKQTDDEDQEVKKKKLPFARRLRAYWAVHGPMYCFVAVVVALQIAFGLWQMV
jgi:hypothetical protein